MSLVTDQVKINRIIFRDQVFTSDYMGKAVDELAHYLDTNIRSNSPIVYLIAPNHIKTIVAFLAICKTGRATLLVDPKTGRIEYEEMLADTRPGAIITVDPGTLAFDFGKEIALTDYEMTRDEIAQLADVCVLLYSNAEDGYAKAAMLTHANILSNAESIAEGNHVDRNSISCAILPFHHLYGFQNGVITPVVASGSLLIADISNLFKISLITEKVVESKGTHIYGTPFFYYLLAKSPLVKSIASQSYSFISGGYKLPGSLRKRYEQKLNIRIYEGYGLTEASPVCTWQFKEDNSSIDSIGRAIKCCTVKIFDETNKEVPGGEKGEICIQGSNVMKGYFNRPEATQQTTANGWLHTGDFGKQDINGNVYFLGLKKKMYNPGGNKVYPAEVKRLMLKNTNVANAQFSSTSNEIAGDKISANITLRKSSPEAGDSFKKWCGKNLTLFKVPERISFS